MHLIKLMQCPTQIVLEHIFKAIIVFTTDNKAYDCKIES